MTKIFRFTRDPDHHFKLSYPRLVSKPAGAINAHGTIFMNKRGYSDCREELSFQMRETARKLQIAPYKKLTHVHFEFILSDMTRDLSNLMETILDSGKGILWADDRCSNLNGRSIHFELLRKIEQESVRIEIWR